MPWVLSSRSRARRNTVTSERHRSNPWNTPVEAPGPATGPLYALYARVMTERIVFWFDPL